MEQMYQIKAILLNSIQGQLSNLESADTHELGEVIDMVKDITEAMYYCSLVDSAQKKGVLSGNGSVNDMDMYSYSRGGNRGYGMYTMNNQYRDPYMDNNRMGNQM